MESLKIRDKKTSVNEEEEIISEQPAVEKVNSEIEASIQNEEPTIVETAEAKRRTKLTIGQKIMESVKKFFEEVE